MQMDAGLDTGDILLQAETDINAQENAIDLMARLSFEGANVLMETLNNLEAITPHRQLEVDASYAPMLVKEEGRIDWAASAKVICNHIRGFQPFPTSFATFHGKKITVWKAEVSYQLPVTSYQLREDSTTNSGRIIEAKGEDFVVACGDKTALRLVEIQIEGKRRMRARDFLNGTQIQIGERLG